MCGSGYSLKKLGKVGWNFFFFFLEKFFISECIYLVLTVKKNKKILQKILSLCLLKAQLFFSFNPIALRKAKIVYNFGLSECNLVHVKVKKSFKMHALPSIFLFR